MQQTLPVLDVSKAPGLLAIFEPLSKTQLGSGEVKTAVLDVHDIGNFVARIIADERTLNRYVLIYSEQVTQKEVFKLAEKVTGRQIALTFKSAEELDREILEIPEDDLLNRLARLYLKSLWISGDNTIENAKQYAYGSALDARELYPDVRTKSLEVFAAEYYADLK